MNQQNVCCVPACSNNNGISTRNTHLYPFPADNALHRQRRQIWISAIKRACNLANTWCPSNRTRLCSNHFAPNIDSQRNPNLFVPTLFPALSQSEDSNGHFLDFSSQTNNCSGLKRGEAILETLKCDFSNRYMEAGKCVRDAEIQTYILVQEEEEPNECLCKETCDGFCLHCSESLGMTFIKTEEETFNDVIEISD